MHISRFDPKVEYFLQSNAFDWEHGFEKWYKRHFKFKFLKHCIEGKNKVQKFIGWYGLFIETRELYLTCTNLSPVRAWNTQPSFCVPPLWKRKTDLGECTPGQWNLDSSSMLQMTKERQTRNDSFKLVLNLFLGEIS